MSTTHDPGLHRVRTRFILGCVVVFVFQVACLLFYSSQEAESTPSFSWEDTPSLETLIWRQCYVDRECARLNVPLNYDDPTGEQASIAIIRKKANVPENSPLYRGPVLINPGGPGVSGVDTVSGPAGDLFSQVLGPQFDIVGFDPRGVARSTPRASFFKQDVQRAIFNQHHTNLYIKDHADVALAWSRAKVLGKLASDSDDGHLAFMTTDNTARDMLSIVRAHGREKLQYWGFSYGTALGATFASMFPENVERVIIDGVVDADYYYASRFDKDLVDVDSVLEAFFTGCADAGPDICLFWAPDPATIRKNLAALHDSVAASPIPVAQGDSIGVLDGTSIRRSTFLSFFSPYTHYPFIGRVFSNPVKYAVDLLRFSGARPFDCACGTDSDARRFEVVDDAAVTIMCNDGAPLPEDLNSAIAFFDELAEASEWAPIRARFGIQCSGWPLSLRPKKQFRGPFTAHTSHPLLLIGNTADPVTPLWGARNMTKAFPGSNLLIQDSVGHCSISAPSVCTARYVREYFINGTLPPVGTICPVDRHPFSTQLGLDRVGSDGPLQATMAADSSYSELFDVVDRLSKTRIVTTPYFY